MLREARDRTADVVDPVPKPIEVFDNLDDDLDRIELWTTALSCFQHPAPEYEPEREGTVGSMLREARDRTADVVDPVPKPIEVFDNLDDDLDRIELWTTALSCFQHPAPEYEPDTVMSDEREGAVNSRLREARDRTADVADPLKSAADDSHAGSNAPHLLMVARNTASPLGDVVRNTIENQPYTAVIIALGLGWLLGRTHRPF